MQHPVHQQIYSPIARQAVAPAPELLQPVQAGIQRQKRTQEPRRQCKGPRRLVQFVSQRIQKRVGPEESL